MDSLARWSPKLISSSEWYWCWWGTDQRPWGSRWTWGWSQRHVRWNRYQDNPPCHVTWLSLGGCQWILLWYSVAITVMMILILESEKTVSCIDTCWSATWPWSVLHPTLGGNPPWVTSYMRLGHRVLSVYWWMFPYHLGLLVSVIWAMMTVPETVMRILTDRRDKGARACSNQNNGE